MISGIYIITNNINNKYYVGSSKNINSRLNRHKYDLINNNHHNEHLQKAVNKYGLENFSFEVLEIYNCSIKILLSLENWWCNMLNTFNRDYGYNIQPINPDGGILMSIETRKKLSLKRQGCKLSEETKKKIGLTKLGNKYFQGKTHTKENKEKASKRNLGKTLSESTKEKLRAFNLGLKKSPETGKKISKSLTGIKRSEETKKKLSIHRYNNPLKPNLGKKLSKETIEKRTLKRIKTIIQYDLEGNFVKEWESIKKAGEELGLSKGNICACCLGVRKQTGGFKWKYINLLNQ